MDRLEEGVHGRYRMAKKMLREEDYFRFALNRSCVWQTRGWKRESKRKWHIYNLDRNKTEIDFRLVDKNDWKY